MWSDNDIDNAFRRLDPTGPEPTPFPLDAWLKLEAELDQAVIDRAVRHRLWQFFAAEVAVVALVGLGWSLWPVGTSVAGGAKLPVVTSKALPMSKTADTKQVRGAGASMRNTPLVAAARPTAGGMAQATPRPAAMLPAPTTVPTVTSPPAAAVISAVSPARRVAGHERHWPLAVVLAPGRYPTRTSLLHSTDGQPTASGSGVAGTVKPTIGPSGNSSTARIATQQSEAHSPQGAVLAAATQARAKTPAPPENSSNTGTADHFATSPMAVPTGAASEGAVADAPSHGGGARGTAAAARHLATTPESGTTDAATRFNGTTIASTTSSANTTSLNPAPVSSLVPVAASVAEPARPAAATIPTTLARSELTPNPLPAVVRQPRFYVGLVAAPDVSTVKFADVQAPRLNVGLTLEYRLGQRWRVATGLQRVTKEYYARREDYDWTNYPRAYTRDFSLVDASCTILDVPLNLRYDAVVGAHYRVFGTAGLSSFFMQRERYTYDYYDNTSNTLAVWDRSFVNANQHLFSVLNLSAGYELGLGPHWRLQAEPYVKVPLAGVGAGKVKLLSAGVYFGLKYGF